jgi:SAM-dependent methyltransferase
MKSSGIASGSSQAVDEAPILDLDQAREITRAILPGLPESELQHLFGVPEAAKDRFEFVSRLMLSSIGLVAVEERAVPLHLSAIHSARLKLVRHLLPPATQILDLGGANAPLYRMGYLHRFSRLVLVDLPPEERHDMFKEVSLERTEAGGEIVLRYGDMTELANFDDDSFDLVWSGQSIEHVSRLDGEKMCKQAFRVLRRGGSFCLDTPNRLLTRVHTGGGFIHPDHKHEYLPSELRLMLRRCGFDIKEEFGVCEMPLTCRSGRFNYQDFFIGGALTKNLDHAYIQYFHCVKP